MWFIEVIRYELKMKKKITKNNEIQGKNETQVMWDGLNYVRQALVTQPIAHNHNICDGYFKRIKLRLHVSVLDM